MSPDRREIASRIDDELEAILEKKSPKLPKGIRKYIRRLKASGNREKAEMIAQQSRERKIPLRKTQIAQLLLFTTIDNILSNDNQEVQTENQVRAVWLMEASGQITNVERIDYLLEIIEASENIGLHSEIERILVETRDKLQTFLPSKTN